MPPTAEFPLRQFGGVPEGVVEDPSGNAWTLISPGTIAEDSNSGGLLAQYQVPSYNALAGVPAGSVLGLITYNAVDGKIWFFEAAANQMASLNPSTGAFAEYPLLPFASNPGVEQIVAGPDGNIYFTEPSLNEVGLFDVRTDRVSQFNMPLADTQPQGITVGGDGNLWFSEGGQNKIGSLNPTTHLVTNYPFEPPSHVTNDQAEGITAGPNNSIWFVTQQNNKINEYNINSGQFTSSDPYWPPVPPNPGPPTPVNANLWSIAAGPDGAIYYTEPAYGWVGIVNGTTGRIYYNPNNPSDNTVGTASEATLPYALIAPGSAGNNMFISAPKAFNGAGTLYTFNVTAPKAGFSGAQLPSVVVTNDANDIISVGNNLYFTDYVDGVGQIGVFNPTTQAYSVYPVPQLPPAPPPTRNQYPNRLAVDSDGNIWFTETNAYIPGNPQIGAIGELVPGTGVVTQSYLTAASSDPVGIAWDPKQQQFWMTEPNVNKLVSYNPATTGSAVAPIVQPPGGVITDPVGILVDNNTDYVWIAEQSAKKIIAYSPFNESILFSFDTLGQPNQLAWGPDGNIWFTESGDGNSPGYVGVLVPSTGAGTGGIKAQIPVSNAGGFLSAGPTSGAYANTMWFSMPGTAKIGEINTSTDTLVGYATAPDTNANALELGPDGNLWFTSGTGNPPWVGAVVLNPNDLGTQVVVTTQPTDAEETFFGGYNYSFGLTVAVENGAGQIDPFVQQGTVTISLNAPAGSNGVLFGPGASTPGPVTLPVYDGVVNFEGLTIQEPPGGPDHTPGRGYTFTVTYSLGLNTPTTSPFTVTGPATHIVVTTQPPATVAAGAHFTVAISAEDANGYIVPTFDDPVRFTIAANPAGNGVLNGTTVLGALYGSAISTNLSIDQEGKGYTLTGTDTNPLVSFNTVTTQLFDVTAAPAVQLVFEAGHEPPAGGTAGQAFATAGKPLVVDAEDQFGQLDTAFNGLVTLTFHNNAAGRFDAASTLTATAKNGVATFTNVAIDSVGQFQIQANDGQLNPGVSTAITISPASPAALAWAAEPPATATAGVPFSVTLNVVDAYGNAEPTYSGTVALALALNGNADAAALGGTATGTIQNGTITLSGVTINAAGNPFTLSASTGDNLKSPASTAVNVVAPKLVVTTQPSGEVTTSSGFTLVVTAETNTGAIDTYFSNAVNLSISSGPNGAILSGSTSANPQSGVATFSNVIVNNPGSYVIQAAGGIATPAQTQALVAIEPQLVVTAQPSGQVAAGTVFTLVVTAETGSGEKDASFTGNITLAVASGPQGGTVYGTNSVQAQGGVATFSNVWLQTAGTYFLQASNAGATPGNSKSITVVANPTVASLYIVQQPPSSVAAGAPFGFEVGGKDQYGNATDLSGSVKVTIANNPGSSTLGGTTTQPASGGVVTFSGLTLNVAAGGYTLQASQAGATSATTGPIGVTVGAAYKLAFAANGEPPSIVDSGASFSAIVDVEDQEGNVVGGYSGTVTITSQPGGIGGTTQVAVASNGSATFNNLKLSANGTYTLKATVGSLVPATSSSVTVGTTTTTPGLIAWVTQPPGQVSRGAGFGAKLDVEDTFGNLETGFNGDVTINLGSNPGHTTLGGTTTVKALNGVVTFSGLSIPVEADGYTLVATAAGVNSLASSPIDVSSSPPTQIAITTQPPASIRDVDSFGLVVQAWTSPNVVDTDFNGPVTLAISSPTGSNALQGTLTVNAVSGIATFSGLTLTQLGNFVLQASVSGVNPVASTGITVSPGPAAQLKVSQQPPGSVTAGSVFSFQVEALDAHGYTVANFSDHLLAQLSPNANNATLGGTTTAVANLGLATFTGLKAMKAGSGYTIQVTDTNPSSALVAITTGPISVTPGSPVMVEFTAPPQQTVTAGVPFSVTVGVADAFGNVVPNYNGTVVLSLPGKPAGPLGGNLTASVVDGLANFTGLTLTTVAGNYQIQATCTTTSLANATTSPVAVAPAAATRLVVTSEPPVSVPAGSEFGVAVTAVDAYGNAVPSFGGSVTLAARGPSGTGKMTGPLTTQASAGVAAFPPTLAIDTAGNGWVIQASSPGLSSGDSTPITVTGLAATHLGIVQQPPSTLQPGASFGFVVGAEDQYGNINAGFSGPVTIALQSANGATLGGATQVNMTNGVASFQGLTLSNLTSQVTIVASSSALGQAQTGAIGPAPNSGPAGTPSPTPTSTPVSIASIQVFTTKKKQVTEVLVTFNGPVDAASASILADYSLKSPGKHKSYTAKNAKSIPFRSAVYNPGNDTVALTPAKRLVVKKPLQLTILGTGGSAIKDSSGHAIGKNTVAILAKAGKGVSVRTMAVSSAMVDVLFEQGPPIRPTKKPR